LNKIDDKCWPSVLPFWNPSLVTFVKAVCSGGGSDSDSGSGSDSGGAFQFPFPFPFPHPPFNTPTNDGN